MWPIMACLRTGLYMVGTSGIEPPTTTMSRWCSTTELRAYYSPYHFSVAASIYRKFTFTQQKLQKRKAGIRQQFRPGVTSEVGYYVNPLSLRWTCETVSIVFRMGILLTYTLMSTIYFDSKQIVSITGMNLQFEH